MLSVRKEEVLTNGLLGITCMIFSILDFFTYKDILACIVFPVIVVVYIAGYVYRRRRQNEPWDEMASAHYARARRITLLFVEFTLLIWGLICVTGHFHPTIRASHLMFYYGTIKLVQTGAFLYYDSHITE